MSRTYRRMGNVDRWYNDARFKNDPSWYTTYFGVNWLEKKKRDFHTDKYTRSGANAFYKELCNKERRSRWKRNRHHLMKDIEYDYIESVKFEKHHKWTVW
jgi:hypothetical protein